MGVFMGGELGDNGQGKGTYFSLYISLFWRNLNVLSQACTAYSKLNK